VAYGGARLFFRGSQEVEERLDVAYEVAHRPQARRKGITVVVRQREVESARTTLP
jgi:hypothetical protein